MQKSYAAYGLALHSSFTLPGMKEASGEGLPALKLGLQTPAELYGCWSGRGAFSPWHGRLGDGARLTIEQGVEGDLLFTYGSGNRFHLDPRHRRLQCAPLNRSRIDWQRVLVNRVLPNASIAYGREALHASAVLTALGVVAIAAPSGMGKSTIASELLRRGWPLFADDVLILARRRDRVEAQPGTPHMNLPVDLSNSGELGLTLAILGDERWIAAKRLAPGAQEVAAIVILERGQGLSLGVQDLPGSPLVLAPFMIGLAEEDGRDASRFELYCDLACSTRLLRLSAALSDSPADLADALEATLGLRTLLAAQGAA